MYNLRRSNRLPAYDQTQAVKFTWVYELPVREREGISWGMAEWLAAIVGGWRISGIQTYASGLPMNIGTNAPSFPHRRIQQHTDHQHVQRLDTPLLGQVPAFPGELSATANFLPDAVFNLVRQFHPVQPGLPQLAPIQRGMRGVADLHVSRNGRTWRFVPRLSTF